MTPLFLIGLPILLIAGVGLVGSTRRLGFWWTVVLSVLLTPIGGFIVAVLTGARRPKKPLRPAPALAAPAYPVSPPYPASPPAPESAPAPQV